MSPTKMSRIRKLLVPILVVTALGGAGLGARQALANKKPTVEYQTAAVEQGAVAARVTATGTLSALVTVQVGSQVSGRVKELHANFNSEVKKGDVLAEIDPELFQASLEQAQANVAAASGSLARARAQLTNAKAQYARAQELAKQGLVAQADVDTAKAAADSAAADVAAGQGQVAQASAGAPPGADQPRVHEDRLARRRHRHLAQRRRRPDCRRGAPGADALHDRRRI